MTLQSQSVDVKVLGRRVNADVEPGYATPFGVEPEGSLARRKKARQRVWGHMKSKALGSLVSRSRSASPTACVW